MDVSSCPADSRGAIASANSRTSSSSTKPRIHATSASWRWYRALENRGIHPLDDCVVFHPVWSEWTWVRNVVHVVRHHAERGQFVRQP
jgi:hypothetical protein